ncbi:hypothetical protein ILUMI_00118 [Ignelater luminosus]|uniref:BAG domain-containing protein n=1 Tax=Ignelater luminosus TaxID=2038154 RepID=A0A8K0DT86_IGNLU|nr:hypothetical protein ILUMI_00118 [Ignelater luminosus]
MDQMPFAKSAGSNISRVSTHSIPSIKSQSATEKEVGLRANKDVESSQSSKMVDSKCESQHQTDAEAKDESKFACDILKLIDSITGEAENLRPKIENFSGSSTDDKDYIYLEEMLMRGTVQLDDIDTRGNALIRQERKKSH